MLEGCTIVEMKNLEPFVIHFYSNEIFNDTRKLLHSQSVCMFDKVFASFSLLTRNIRTKENCTSIDMHNLDVDMYCDL